jgi:N-acetyl-D-muramate 6-phosphate phosphatase
VTARATAVLFDLDGTLVDTAPDLVDAVNRTRAALGLPPVPEAQVRPHVSRGGMAMLRAGIPEAGEPDQRLLQRFLDLYLEHIFVRSTLFPGMPEVLEAIEARGLPWGIVTNKPGWLTTPLLAAMGLAERTRCAISGDTLPVRKPAPDPVLLACRQLGCDPAATLMVGDDLRDVQAGNAAGAISVVAEWGYLGVEEPHSTWGAPYSIATPGELLALLK